MFWTFLFALLGAGCTRGSRFTTEYPYGSLVPQLVIRDIHVANPHAVLLSGIGPTADYLDMTSPSGSACKGSFVAVHLVGQEGRLRLRHLGKGFAAIFRASSSPVSSASVPLHPVYLPTDDFVVGQTLNVADGDILCLVLAHHQAWSMFYQEFCRCYDADYGVWAERLLHRDSRASIILARIGTRTTEPAAPYKIIFSGDQAVYYKAAGNEQPRMTLAPSVENEASVGQVTSAELLGNSHATISIATAENGSSSSISEPAPMASVQIDEALPSHGNPFEPVPRSPSPSPDILAFSLPSVRSRKPRVPRIATVTSNHVSQWAGRTRSSGSHAVEPPHKRPRKSGQ